MRARTGAPCDDRAQPASRGRHRGCKAPRPLEASPPHLLTPPVHGLRSFSIGLQPAAAAAATIAREPPECTWHRPTAQNAAHLHQHPAHPRRWRSVGAVLARHMRSVGRRIGGAEEERLGSAAVLQDHACPQRQQDWAHPCPIGTGTGLTPRARSPDWVRALPRNASDRGWAGLCWDRAEKC